MEKYTNLLETNKNLIFTGAPGTGKTFLAKQIADIVCQSTQTDQETAIRQIIDVRLKKGAVYKTKSGTAEFVITKIVDDAFICEPKNGVHSYEVTKEDIVDCIISGKIDQPVKNYDEFNRGGTYIVGLSYFVQGNLKNNKGEVAFVQLHPSYDYTDFVEGLRPIKKEDNLGFELKNGIFKAFCKKAKENPTQKYVFIIDEINRAEISKVFGELMFSIDPGYRGEAGKVKTQYSNIQTEETAFTDDVEDDYFYIPENVYIIGTMNDIDRSVESFDFALRRRFAWKEITAKDSLKMLDTYAWKSEKAKAKIDKIKSVLTKLNEAIDAIQGLNSAYHIGAAYFLKLDNYDGDFIQLWNNHFKGILSEYLRGMPNAETNLEELEKAYNNAADNGQ